MCNGCAFRKGCETWTEPRNRLVSQICAAGPIPFYCHEGMPWTNPIAHLLTARRLAQLAGGLRVCQGWRRAVAKREWSDNPDLRLYQRWLAAAALKSADAFLAGGLSVRELQRDLTPLAQYYRGPRAWQIARMMEAKK